MTGLAATAARADTGTRMPRAHASLLLRSVVQHERLLPTQPAWVDGTVDVTRFPAVFVRAGFVSPVRDIRLVPAEQVRTIAARMRRFRFFREVVIPVVAVVGLSNLIEPMGLFDPGAHTTMLILLALFVVPLLPGILLARIALHPVNRFPVMAMHPDLAWAVTRTNRILRLVHAVFFVFTVVLDAIRDLRGRSDMVEAEVAAIMAEEARDGGPPTLALAATHLRGGPFEASLVVMRALGRFVEGLAATTALTLLALLGASALDRWFPSSDWAIGALLLGGPAVALGLTAYAFGRIRSA